MVYLCLCGLAKTLQILNQQENYYVHKACNRPSCERKWNAKLRFCFLMVNYTPCFVNSCITQTHVNPDNYNHTKQFNLGG